MMLDHYHHTKYMLDSYSPKKLGKSGGGRIRAAVAL